VATWTPSLAVAFLVAVFLLTAGRCVAYFCRGQLAKAYASPALVRNMNIPTGGSSRPRSTGVVVAGAVGEAGVLLPTLLGAPAGLVLLLGLLAAGLLFALTVPLAREVIRNRHERVPVGELPPKLRPLQAFIHRYQPEVLVHLSGGLADTYQINVWLETLEQLDQRVLLLLRNPDMFEAMGSDHRARRLYPQRHRPDEPRPVLRDRRPVPGERRVQPARPPAAQPDVGFHRAWRQRQERVGQPVRQGVRRAVGRR
jgi:hypothetical protein